MGGFKRNEKKHVQRAEEFYRIIVVTNVNVQSYLNKLQM